VESDFTEIANISDNGQNIDAEVCFHFDDFLVWKFDVKTLVSLGEFQLCICLNINYDFIKKLRIT
jgi:hypothetical protein